MAPAFGLVEAKGLLPYFMESVTKARELPLHLILKANSSLYHQMADKWDEIIGNSDSGNAAVIDVNAWLGKATLDTCVPVPALCAWGGRLNSSLKGRCWSFRLRLRRVGRN